MQQAFSLIPEGWTVKPNGLSVKIIAPTAVDAQCFSQGAKRGLTQLSKRLGVPIQIFAEGSEVAEFGKLAAQATGNQPMTQEQQNILWFAQIAVSPALLRIANQLMENPSMTGVVRLSDELQVIMSDGCAVLNPGHTLTEATTWKRPDFWHPQDLADFRRMCRQQSELEFTWRSFDPLDPTKTIDLEFTTRYRLVDGQDGQHYQVCDNLGMRQL